MNISNALAQALEIDEYNDATNNKFITKSRTLRSKKNKPFLQLMSFPKTINAKRYKNPKSNSNPSGNLRTLYNFRQLVDPIPAMEQMYSASSSSTERIYEMILEGSNILNNSSFTASVISKSKRRFNKDSYSNMDRTPGKWRPVYANPEDWHSADNSRFKNISIDLTKTGQSDEFNFNSGNEELYWTIDGEKCKTLHPATKITSIEMKYLLVGLHRPWFNPLLFQISNWYLSSECIGFCSSGELENNDGVFPIIPTSILVGKEVNINASWSKEDRLIINNHKAEDETLKLGPFLVCGRDSSKETIQIIGWVSELMPLSPKETKLTTNAVVTVSNKGAFVARFSVRWEIDGKRREQSSGTFPVLANKEIEIPAEAINISVKIEIMTFPKPVETWSTVKKVQLENPKMLKYKLSGTTLDPKVDKK